MLTGNNIHLDLGGGWGTPKTLHLSTPPPFLPGATVEVCVRDGAVSPHGRGLKWVV